MKTLLLLLLCCISAMAQTRDDLQKKYGIPVLESYEVRPDILATVRYSKEGKICRLMIEPKQSGLKFSEVKHDLLTKLIVELVPPESRGGNLLSGFFSMADADGGIDTLGTLSNYEKLTINRSINKKKEISVFISWKDKSCNSEFGKPFSFTTQFDN